MIRGAAACHQREPHRHREAEGVEERQHANDAVFGAGPEKLGDGFEASVKTALLAVLCSNNFLYLVEGSVGTCACGAVFRMIQDSDHNTG